MLTEETDPASDGLFLDLDDNDSDINEFEDERGEDKSGKINEDESKKNKKKPVKNKTFPPVSRPYFQPRQVYTRGRGGRVEVKRLFNRRPSFNQVNNRPDLRREIMAMRRRDGSRSKDDPARRRGGRSRSRERRSRSKDLPTKHQDILPKVAEKKLINKSGSRDTSIDQGLKIKNNGKNPTGRVGRSRSIDGEPRNQDKRSNSRDDDNRATSSKTGDMQSFKGRRSRSRDYYKVRGRRSRSRDRSNHPRSHNRRSRSRERRSRSRGRRSRSRDRRLMSRERRSRSRCRRSLSQDRRSKSRDRRLSRDRLSSRDRHSRSRSIKRGGRRSKSDSRSRSSSRGRRRSRSYSSGGKSSSSDVIAYKPRVELIDVDKYEEDRRRRGDFQQQSQFSNTLMPTSAYGSETTSGVQFSQTPPGTTPPFHNAQFHSNQPPPMTSINPYEQAPQFSQDQPPPAPFISGQTVTGPPRMVGQTQSPQQFLTQAQHPRHPGPPVHMQQQNIVPSQFPVITSGQPEEFGGYQQNMGGEFSSGFANYNEVAVSTERYLPHMARPTQLHAASFNPHTSKDFNPNVGAKWSVTPQNQPSQSSSNLIYPGSGTTAPSSKPTPKKTGVEEERQNQKQTLVIQRDQYLIKRSKLQKDLTCLKEQRTELLQENLPETERLLKENTKLQNEINQRLKAIENVIEMLSGLIKKDLISTGYKIKSPSPRPRSRTDKDGKRSGRNRNRSSSSEESLPRNKYRDASHSSDKNIENPVIELASSPPPLILPKYTRDRSPPIQKSKHDSKPCDLVKPMEIGMMESKSYNTAAGSSQTNIVHYDPELHWCSLCNIFPKTSSDYLNHLHTSKHKQQVVALKLDPSPWHADEIAELPPPVIKNAPLKRIPIRGVQFLVPASGWYCRLCKAWIGDLHCAQEHLKGKKHSSNYTEYITQNPHWEVDWLSDRTKSFERSSEYLSRLREKEPSPDLSALSDTLLAVLAKQNKRQRQSSTSSSDSSSSDSKDKKKQRKSKKKKSKKRKKKDSSPEKSTVKVEKPSHVPNYRQKENEETSQNSDMITNWMEPEKIDQSLPIRLKSKFKQREVLSPEKLPDSDWHIEVGSYGETSKGSDKLRDDGDRSDNRNIGDKVRHELNRDDRGIASLQRGRSDIREERGRTDIREDRGRTDIREDRSRADVRDDRGRDDRGRTDIRDDRGRTDIRDDRGRIDFREDRSRADVRDDRGRDDRGRIDFREDRGRADIRDDRGRTDFREDRGRSDNRGRTDIKDDRGRIDDKSREQDKVTKQREEKGSNRNWNNQRENQFRKESKEIVDIKQNYNQMEDVAQQKKLDHQKTNIFSQLSDVNSTVERKRSPIRVFQRPDDSPDRDSPEPVMYQEKKDRFSKNDKPQGKLWFPSKESKDEDVEETIIFEKICEEKEVVPKKKVEIKKTIPFTISKTKLPFIGRMPILKKRTVEQKLEEPAKEKTHVSDKSFTWPNIPNAEEGPQLPKTSEKDKVLLSNKGQASDVAIVKQPVVTSERYKINEDNLAEQDMDIANDDQDDVIWVENQEKTELHPDFQDALDLLFPEEDKQSKKEEKTCDNQYDHNLIYGSGFDNRFDCKVYGGDISSNHPGFPSGHPMVSPLDPSVPGSGPPQLGPLGCPPPPLITGTSHLGSDGPMIIGPGVSRPMGPPPSIGPGPMGGRMGNEGPLMMLPRGPPPPMGSSPVGENPLVMNHPSTLSMGQSVPPGGNDNPLMMGPPRQPLGPGIPSMGPSSGSMSMAPGIPPMGLAGPPGAPSLYSPDEDFVEEVPTKRKNAPSQRMRRHLQKKRAKEEAEKAKAEAPGPPPLEEKKQKYEGMDLSDLAMLGIDEDDSIIC